MYAIIDVETTGGTAQFERVTEIAVVIHDGVNVLDSFSSLVNPERSIPWNIVQLTGITDEMVSRAPKFYEIARKIVEMTEDRIFVAHNASFDYHFIREEFKRLGYEFNRKQLCTVRMSRKAFPGLPSYSLSNLKRHFGIKAAKSHRALDDALATVELFERILSTDKGSALRKMVRAAIKDTKLPDAISVERFEAVPEACGVYYLHDAEGTPVYVGKSLNIKKRLVEHFSDTTHKGEKIRAAVADISFEETGSELLALLWESAEIKRLQPPINRALRQRKNTACLYQYVNQGGYECLVVAKKLPRTKKGLEVVSEFHKLDGARSWLMQLVKQYELCYRLTHLDSSTSACFHYGIKQCLGACVGAEPPDAYNERVRQALRHVDRRLSGNFFLLDKGRNPEELTIVAVENGKYVGFARFHAEEGVATSEDILSALHRPSIEDPDAEHIIHGYLQAKKGLRVVKW